MSKIHILGLVFLSVWLFISSANAQTISTLEKRVESLEYYVDGFQPKLNKFSDDVTNSVRNYNQGLELSLKNYFLKLQNRMEDRLGDFNNRVVALDITGQKFQRIDTDGGVFLLSVKEMLEIENGYRILLNIGNINLADYRDYTLRVSWGPKWYGSPEDSQAEWRSGLNTAEFSYKGVLNKGVWNPVKIDLIPAEPGQVEYIECEMEVSSVILEYK